jgi:pimeloyl-ACP methyl ester carboxylesterase
VTYDRRGHGRTADPGHGYDLDILADDLGQVIETLHLKDVVLVGYSMGAAEAVRYMTRHGQGRVAKMLYLSPVTPCQARAADNPDGIDPASFAAARQVMAKDFPAALEAGFPGFMDKGCSEPMKAWVKGLMLQNSLNAMIACQAAWTGVDLRAEMKHLTRPSLVIQGDADKSAPIGLTGRRTAELLGCEIKVYPGSPHGIPFTDTDRLNADIVGFAKA